MDPGDYLSHLRDDSTALLAAADQAPGAPVASCPAWDVTGLVRHTAVVHHWVTTVIGTRAARRPVTRFDEEAPTEWPAVRAWYLDGVEEVTGALKTVDPQSLVWNWRDDSPAPAGFWHRRMAHETAIHRWDAQHAVGADTALDTELAIDGVDEFLGFLPGWLSEQPVPGLEGSLSLVATDVDAAVTLTLHPDRLETRWGSSADRQKTETTVTAVASDLALWLTARRSADWPDLVVEGDRSLVEAWAAVSFD